MYGDKMEEDSGYYNMGNGWDYNNDMSANASDAMEKGRFPLSWWESMKKEKILEHIYKVIDRVGGSEVLSFNTDLLKMAQKQALINLFIHSKGEYHHMPVWRNHRRYKYGEVLFCEIVEEKLLTVTDEQIKNEIDSIRRSNSEKNSEMKYIIEENRKRELNARKSKPLRIGYFTKPATFKGRPLKWDYQYIGVIDGTRLYYYGFPKYERNTATLKRNVEGQTPRYTHWPSGGEAFDTFADFIKTYPQFVNKEEEIACLMRNREADRAKKKI